MTDLPAAEQFEDYWRVHCPNLPAIILDESLLHGVIEMVDEHGQVVGWMKL